MVPLSLAFIAYSEMNGIGAAGVLHGWSWLLLPATGIVTAVPMLFFTAGMKGAPVTVSGICMYLAPGISMIIGLLTGKNFDTWQVDVFGVTIMYGAFITSVINFVIMALVVFLLVKGMNALSHLGHHHKADAPTTKQCPFCKTTVDVEATRCPACTSLLDAAPNAPEQV